MTPQFTQTATRLIVAMTLASGGLVTVASAQPARYTVQDLGPAARQSNATSINDSGVAVGWLQPNDPNIHDTRAARTVPGGTFEFLPGLQSVSSSAEGINVFGDIAGFVQVFPFPNAANHAMRYTQARGVEDLGTLGGQSSFAYHINRSGQVSGWSYMTSNVTRAFIATPGQPMRNLGTFSGSPTSSSFAGGINDAGQIAGHAETSSGRWHAFRYNPGAGLQELGTPIGSDSFANDINTAGQVVGRVYSATGEHAFRYTDGVGMQDLHSLGATSNAFSLNDRGDVVGYIYTSGSPSRAFLYTDADGMIDLNSRIDAASGWVLNAAYGINAAGEIVGQGTYQGGFLWRAFKLTPIPPDTTPPAVTVPANMTIEAGSFDGVTVTFSASAIDAVDGPTSAVCLPVSGSTFPLGATTVSCQATDAAGNHGSESFTINVVDTTPPAVTVPAPITTRAMTFAGTPITFAASAADLVDGVREVVCAPASGSTFAIGTTTVSCLSVDTRGNPATATFTATVTFDFLQARTLILALINAVRTGNTAAACSQLSGVVPVIQSQVGSRLTQADATILIRIVTDAKRSLGCR